VGRSGGATTSRHEPQLARGESTREGLAQRQRLRNTYSKARAGPQRKNKPTRKGKFRDLKRYRYCFEAHLLGSLFSKSKHNPQICVVGVERCNRWVLVRIISVGTGYINVGILIFSCAAVSLS